MILTAVHLGRIDYTAALAVQQQVAAWRREDRIADTVLLLEHPPVITLGRNARREHVIAGDALLQQRGVSLLETNRGGDVTYHGPGQLVCYVIFRLGGGNFPPGVVQYMRNLEEVIIRTCAGYGVLTERVAGRTGVWTIPGGSLKEKKIAALGLHVSRGVTTHGFALNVTTDLNDFQLIVPCGIADRGVTSLEAEMGPAEPPSLGQAADAVVRHFGRIFARPVVWVETVDDLLSGASHPGEHTAAAGLH